MSRLTSYCCGFPSSKPSEELPIRLAHRVKELDELPHNLSAMPSINKVKNWYAQSFEVRNHRCLCCCSAAASRLAAQELISFPTVKLPRHIREALLVPPPDYHQLPESTPNPSLAYMSEDYAVMSNSFMHQPPPKNGNGSGQSQKMRIPMERRFVSCVFLNFTTPISPHVHARVTHQLLC